MTITSTLANSKLSSLITTPKFIGVFLSERVVNIWDVGEFT